MKKTILHIIDDLGRGGAENILVTTVKELTDYNNIVVTLYPKNNFESELHSDKYYCLHLKSIVLLPLAISKLKKIIRENKVDIVHSHLFWSTTLARLATPKRIPLLTTIHLFVKSSLEYKLWYIRFLDKITYRLRKNIILADAKGAENEYFEFLKLKPYISYTPYTFVDTKLFNKKAVSLTEGENKIFKLVSVGALRMQKNQQFLLEAFRQLKNDDYQLDIYGEGELRPVLSSFIAKHKLNVNLKGIVTNIHDLITGYDLFVMSSTYEGFSLGVLESMAVGMPLLLSDIESFKEQCGDTAVYYSLNNVNDFIAQLKKLQSDKKLLIDLSIKAYNRVINNFTLDHHMKRLRNIYQESLSL